jgi:hypothetical protein
MVSFPGLRRPERSLNHPSQSSVLTPRSRVLLEKLTGFQLVKKFPAIYVTQGSITAAVSEPALYRLLTFPIPNLMTIFLLLMSYQIISPSPKLSVWRFRNKIRFYGEELLASRPVPNLKDHPLSAVRDCLFNIFAATLHTGGRSSIRNWRKRHAVVTGPNYYH